MRSMSEPALRPPPLGLSTTPRRKPPISPAVVVGIVKTMDFCLVLISAAVAGAFYLVAIIGVNEGWDRYILVALIAAALFVGGFRRVGGYEFKRMSMLRWQVTRVGAVWGAATLVLLMLAFIGKVSDTYSRGWAVEWASTGLGLLFFSRAMLYLAIGKWVRQGRLVRKIIIVGAGEPGERLIAKLQATQAESVSLIGVFDDRRSRIAPSIRGVEVLGTTDDLVRFAREAPINEIIVALPLSAEQRLKALFDKLKLLPADLRLSAEPVADAFPVRGISYIGGVPMLEIVDRPLKHWNGIAKSVEDFVVGNALLAALAPLMAIIALLIKLDSRGPILFVQDRFGFNNKVIRVLKFRTMYTEKTDPSGAAQTTRSDPRVTRVGRFLRAFSLDELPQLFNVLSGDMSLVGPRAHPLSMKAGDKPYYDAVRDYFQRHRVKPGITGWAQINGLRGETDTIDKASQRVSYDLYYIDNWSLWLDLKVLLLSFRVFVARENAY